MTEKVVLASKSLFQPVNGVWSTGLLVGVHNIFSFSIVKQFSIVELFKSLEHSGLEKGDI